MKASSTHMKTLWDWKLFNWNPHGMKSLINTLITKHFRYQKWSYSPIQAVCKAHVRENPPTKIALIRFSTSTLGTWKSWWSHVVWCFFVPGGFGRRSSWTLFRCLGRNGYLWTLHFDGGASLSRIVGGDTSGWIDTFLLVGMGLGVWCMNVCGLLACKKMWLFFVVQDSDTYHGFGQWICFLKWFLLGSDWMMAVIVSDITRELCIKVFVGATSKNGWNIWSPRISGT